MSNHLIEEYIALQLTDDAPFHFKIEIYADNLFIDTVNSNQMIHFQQDNYHSITFDSPIDGSRQIKITGTNIFYINVSQLHLTSLTLSHCLQLEYLNCAGNKLRRLNIEQCEALEEVHCHSNYLTNLKIPPFSKINLLDLADNQIEELQFNNCSSLQTLYCGQNQLRRLCLSGCISINDINISDNLLEANTLTDIFNQLPLKEKNDFAMIHYLGNPGSAACEKSALTLKNWR